MNRMESGRNMNEQREVKEKKKRMSNRDLKRNCISMLLDLKSSTIAEILKVINKSLDLVVSSRSKPLSIEVLLASTEESLMQEVEKFLNNLMKLCDQICIPNVISNLRNLYDTAVPEIFFKILNKLLHTCPADSNEMAKKFVSSCFIRISLETKAQHPEKASSASVNHAVNEFLETLCCFLLSKDVRGYAKNLLISSLPRVSGTAQELLQVLKQNNLQDEALRNTQECILVLYYLSYGNGDRLTPRGQLLHALSTFLVLNPTCYCDSSVVVLRCLTPLYIKELHRENKPLDSSPLSVNAQRILGEGLLRNIEKLSALHFHDLALLEWAMVCQNVHPDLRKEIIKLWFSHGGRSDIREQEMSFWRKMVDDNPRTLLMLVSIVSTADAHAQVVILKVIQHVLESCRFEMIKQVLPELKRALQKLFLNQAVEPLPSENMENIVRLLCLLVTNGVREALDEEDIKLAYHVVNFLTHQASSSGLKVGCLNFLNASVVQDTKNGSDKVLSFLLNHQEYNSFLEKAIRSFQCGTEVNRTQQSSILAAVLISISHLVRLQNNFSISTKNVISVNIDAVLPLLCHSSRPLLQFAANVFWESVLKCLEPTKIFETNLSLFSEETSRSGRNIIKNADSSSKIKISKLHVRMILVYLQNSLFHVNALIKMTALRCLEALFSLEEYVDLIQEPWNTMMLRECKDISSPASLGFTMRLYSLFLRHNRLKTLTTELPIGDLVKAVLEPIDHDGNAEVDLFPDMYVSALPRFFNEVVRCSPELMTGEEKSKLQKHVKQLLGDYGMGKDGEHEKQFVYLQEMLVHDKLIRGNMRNIRNSLNGLLTILKQC